MDEYTACELSYKNGYEAGFKEARRWHSVKDLPKLDNRQYFIKTKTRFGDITYGVAWYAKDLYQVDKHDFVDKKGVSGFYYADLEYGFIDYEPHEILGWMEIPD